MDENRNNQPQTGGAGEPQNVTARPGDTNGAPRPVGRLDKLKERTARIRKQADDEYEDKPLSRRQRRKRRLQDEAVEYYYDDDAAARRAGLGCLIAFLIVCAILGGILLTGWNWYKSEIGGGHATATGTVEISVGSGYGASSVGSLLEDNGLIGNSMVFRLYARYLTDESPKFKQGTFQVEAGASYDEIIELLSSADALPEVIPFRVRDGVTIMAVASDFEDTGLGTSDEFLAVANDLSRFDDITFISKYLEDFESNVFHPAEGLIFPATYEFYEGTSVEDIVRDLYQHIDSKFTAEMYERMGEMGLSLREFMAFASIVQAESGFVAENANVAGVFWNRLNNPDVFPYLDSDPTLMYVKQWMNWNLDEYETVPFADILYAEAREAVGEDKFYAYTTVSYAGYGGDVGDTRAHVGIPNGPIRSVTEAVIEATLYPAEHDYFFFVTYQIGKNEFVYLYAADNAGHEANVVEAKEKDAQYAEQVAAGGGEETLDDVNPDVYEGGDEGGDEPEGEAGADEDEAA